MILPFNAPWLVSHGKVDLILEIVRETLDACSAVRGFQWIPPWTSCLLSLPRVPRVDVFVQRFSQPTKSSDVELVGVLNLGAKDTLMVLLARGAWSENPRDMDFLYLFMALCLGVLWVGQFQ